MICKIVLRDSLNVYADRDMTQLVGVIPNTELVDVKCFRLSMAERSDGRWAMSLFLEKIDTNAD